ncbi:hypothetical protein [Priestia koreensis]|uniref:Uncharacterized protein n=1 Tax=Priestia koreensis TaxID=284581 RepID=A0A0M0KQV0_9BACI|nr:hypothetical protein [Priestia koreensis]KOO41200.1 hypothetical protein AMD01_19880 [Priestia koreensis]MCM3005951.1 hypothetical protein [Priestia koreensis]UNL85293.1 hypothetical protein IE339_01765 [Priestia koreensis]
MQSKKQLLLGILYLVIVLAVYLFHLPLRAAFIILGIVVLVDLLLSIGERNKFKIIMNAITLVVLVTGAILL